MLNLDPHVVTRVLPGSRATQKGNSAHDCSTTTCAFEARRVSLFYMSSSEDKISILSHSNRKTTEALVIYVDQYIR